MSENQRTISDWAAETFGNTPDNLTCFMRAKKEFVELQLALQENDNHPKSGEEIADVFICLYRLADRMGYDLHAEIDKKMAINRARKWKVSADGTGQHED